MWKSYYVHVGQEKENNAAASFWALRETFETFVIHVNMQAAVWIVCKMRIAAIHQQREQLHALSSIAVRCSFLNEKFILHFRRTSSIDQCERLVQKVSCFTLSSVRNSP